MQKFLLQHSYLYLCLILGASTSQELSVDTGPNTTGTTKRGKVLIARDSTEFKDALAQKSKLQLEKLTLDVELIGIKELKKRKSVDYDAIIIINEVRAWHLNRNTTKFLRALNQTERKKIIMVSTARGIDWKSRQTGIDAVTVASEMSSVEQHAEYIFKKIFILLALD